MKKELIFSEINSSLSNYTAQYILEYKKLVEDFMYKNIPTHILKAMKLKIENELIGRKINNDR